MKSRPDIYGGLMLLIREMLGGGVTDRGCGIQHLNRYWLIDCDVISNELFDRTIIFLHVNSSYEMGHNDRGLSCDCHTYNWYNEINWEGSETGIRIGMKICCNTKMQRIERTRNRKSSGIYRSFSGSRVNTKIGIDVG